MPDARECAISLSTEAIGNVWNLAEYKRVEPAHCPTGATSGGTGGERFFVWAYHPLCLRTRLALCVTEVLDLDLTCTALQLAEFFISARVAPYMIREDHIMQ